MATRTKGGDQFCPDEKKLGKRGIGKTHMQSSSSSSSVNSDQSRSTERNPFRDLSFLPDPSHEVLGPDADQAGPSGLGPSNFVWDPAEPDPLASNPSPREASADRSNSPSLSTESSLGDSRSPDVLWRDETSSPEEACGRDILTRMFSDTAKRKPEDNHCNIPTRMFSHTTTKRMRLSGKNHFSRHANMQHLHDSCVSDMSESSPDSTNCSTTSPKDESNGSGMNGHSSSGMNSDQEKQEKLSQATFDKVLIDANQRRQIRNKVRNAGTDSGSDSSSNNMCMDMTEVGVPLVTSGMKLDSTTSESSGIGANYLSAQCDLTLPRSTMLPRSTILPSGVTNSSTGVSTMYNSQGNKVSDESKQESMSSGCSGNRKRHIPWSIARYYYQTKRPNLSNEASNTSEEGPVDIDNALGKRQGQTERKRKRFHRTFTALRQCGLLDLTMQTASLMEQNKKLQKQLGELHRQAHLMYHTVSHFSKIHPHAFVSPEAQKVMEGLKDMVDKNPVGDIDMSMFESTSRDSPNIDSGAFTMSNQPGPSSLNSTGSGMSALMMPRNMVWSQETSGPSRNSNDSAIQSSITTTSSSSEKSGK